MKPNRRILVVDDMPSIHDDFRRVFGMASKGPDLSAEEAFLFGEDSEPEAPAYDVDFAYQGEEALDKVIAAQRSGNPYALAIVDMRMPPGWDGLQTTGRLREVDADLRVVICTAFSDTSIDEVRESLDAGNQLELLRKPFDATEALERAEALIDEWNDAHP